MKIFYLFNLFFFINQIVGAQTQPAALPAYPKVVGYLSFILPIVTIDKNSTTTNFTNGTSIGFPTGINILYSKTFGFSFELTPTIRSAGGLSKVSNLQFAPGPMFRFNKGFTATSRLAFETSGRYGFSLVGSKILVRTKAINYFTAVSLPVRFGNTSPATIGGSLQFGITFN